jgi:hypothetical protein
MAISFLLDQVAVEPLCLVLVGLSKAAVLLLSPDDRMLTDMVHKRKASVATPVALLHERAAFRIMKA